MKKTAYIILIFSLLLSSCKTIDYVPKPEELKYHTKGMWFETTLPDGSQIKGELLAINSQELYILPATGMVLTIKRNDIKKATIHISLSTNSPEALKFGGAIPLLSISHGLFLIFTLPINLAIVIPTVASQRSGTYIVEYPAAVTWEKMIKFARFPQGLPENMDINTLSQR